jgi:LPS-assembly protein
VVLRRRFLALTLLCTVLAASAAQAANQTSTDKPGRIEKPTESEPVLMLADELTYDEELGIVTARGHVEISQGDNVVHADTVSYNQRADKVTATGNVSLTGPEGDTIFADYVELTSDLKAATVETIKMLLSDRSRLAAASGTRSEDGNKTEMNHAVYSPCELCKEDPMRAPLWQIKAIRVTHDKEKKRIEYRDAWLEMFGVPVLYTPYFSHPDPSVKRASGLLAPQFQYSNKLGVAMRLPYFWVLSDDKDATITPIFSTGEYPVLLTEYRQRVRDGSFRIKASGTASDEDDNEANLSEGEFRGHIDATGRFDIDKQWRWGFDIERATDKTYERLYDFSHARTLTSHAFGEMFHARNYASLQGFAFQGTRDIDQNDEAPIVIPLMDYNYVSNPIAFGSYFTMDADALVLSRIEGRESRRLSVKGGWVLPYTSPWGDIYRLSAMVQGDVYSFNGLNPASDDPNPSGPTENGVEGRLFPQISLEWRYPFIRQHEGWHEVVEPIAQIVAGPNGSNPGTIPNEDSLDIEFDENNLFDLNRFAGLDRVDSGQRVNYGLRWSIYGDEGGFASVFLGQSYSFNDNSNFDAGSGLDTRRSDIVGAVYITPADYLDVVYRFRLDGDSLQAQRDELLLKAGPDWLNVDVSYAFLSDEADPDTTFGDRQEIAARLNTKVDDYWSLFIAGRRDLEEGRMLSYGGGVAYEDECFDIRTSIFRNNYEDGETDPGIKVLFSIAFKNLGSFGTDQY